ncbi:T9SS type A sorting domain-containing protein [Fulvivirgaceae bacterium BMA12]|uniref:T9SS type A sorting domain-containing protein n=1 Tax=Agaribacillus aureus TaxID=3051825 RepID=A0ABT8L5E1_9BACT|nr:T9SS type A sorting domain-containing protein [Fulvivirgaceae bacterium BMA12]
MRQAYLDNGWDGFGSITEEQQVLTARSNNEFRNFTVYPNPTRDKVHIDPGLGQELKQVNIYTMTGAYLYSENGLEINTGRLSRGTYLSEIVTQTGDRSMKRVIYTVI